MPKRKPDAKYVSFTEELNGLDYLEKAYDAIRHFPRDRKAWKWVVIGLHGAIYSFAICAIKGADWTGVTRPGTRKLIAFDEAIKRCESTEWMSQFVRSRPVRLTDEQKDAIRFLKNVRNQLEHYVPLDWKIEARPGHERDRGSRCRSLTRLRYRQCAARGRAASDRRRVHAQGKGASPIQPALQGLRRGTQTEVGKRRLLEEAMTSTVLPRGFLTRVGAGAKTGGQAAPAASGAAA